MKQRRGIDRILIRAGTFLLLGAILSIAVAWGCAVAFQAGYVQRNVSHSWSISHFEVPASHDQSPTILQVHSSPGFRVAASAFGPIEPDSSPIFITERLAGWPCAAVYSNDESSGWGKPVHRHYEFDITVRGNVPYVLSWLPILPGFAINTLFYAAILWLLFAAPFALRRMWRIKRGLCPACAYPVGARNLCTECGGAVRASTT